MEEPNQFQAPSRVHSNPSPTFGSYATAILKARSAIGRHFDASLFGDPALEMMLELFVAGEQGRTVTVPDCASLASVPASTGLRWLARLENEGIIERSIDPAGRHQAGGVSLTKRAKNALEAYLSSISSIPLRR